MIYAIGDSYTYGDELDSQDQAWPAVLGQLLDKPVTNLGKPGCGNTRIVKRAIDAVLNGGAELLVIGWTDVVRQEFADNRGIFDLRGGLSASNMVTGHRQDLAKYHTAYNVEEYYYTKWLRQVILLQSLCNQHNVKCLMFISCGAHVSNQQFLSKHQNLAKHIDTLSFVGWPTTAMQTWTFHLPRGPDGHTLQEGHQLTAKKIHEHIRN
jgi:hypothetical protein